MENVRASELRFLFYYFSQIYNLQYFNFSNMNDKVKITNYLKECVDQIKTLKTDSAEQVHQFKENAIQYFQRIRFLFDQLIKRQNEEKKKFYDQKIVNEQHQKSNKFIKQIIEVHLSHTVRNFQKIKQRVEQIGKIVESQSINLKQQAKMKLSTIEKQFTQALQRQNAQDKTLINQISDFIHEQIINSSGEYVKKIIREKETEFSKRLNKTLQQNKQRLKNIFNHHEANSKKILQEFKKQLNQKIKTLEIITEGGKYQKLQLYISQLPQSIFIDEDQEIQRMVEQNQQLIKQSFSELFSFVAYGAKSIALQDENLSSQVGHASSPQLPSYKQYSKYFSDLQDYSHPHLK